MCAHQVFPLLFLTKGGADILFTCRDGSKFSYCLNKNYRVSFASKVVISLAESVRAFFGLDLKFLFYMLHVHHFSVCRFPSTAVTGCGALYVLSAGVLMQLLLYMRLATYFLHLDLNRLLTVSSSGWHKHSSKPLVHVSFPV